MMQEFETMVRFKRKTIPVNEMIKITKIVIAGNLSKKKEDNYFNTSSGLFEQSLKEMKYITQKFKGKIDTAQGLAGAGDLYVSVLGGRNAKLGFYLGMGYLYKSIIKKQMKNVTVEGAELIKSSGTKILSLVGQKKLPLLKRKSL